MNSIDGLDRGSRWLTPTRQFYIALISACLVGTLVIYLGSTQRIISQSRALRRTLREIESTHNQTLESLSVVLDARDSNTEGHSRRVSEYTMAIAEQMGLSDVELEDVGRGALLHDVGKMGVPDAILFKPGPLSAEEWVEMRKHPDFGYRMMAHIEFLRGSLPVIRHHHERYYGTGYPLGLGGDQIPLGARIFAVADALDAITSDRPYRKAGTFAAAAEEISRHNETQFDPKVVAAYAAIPTSVWIRISEGVAAERGSAWGILQSISGFGVVRCGQQKPLDP